MRALRSESEIISSWKQSQAEPLVSVMCLTYNHEKYIEDALYGFLIQETDFPFEVLIHDDASTDKTADIIREYEVAYPNIIKPIYQSENQWSKDKKVIRDAQYGRIKGNYLAYCEGDDYWIHPYKLQKQMDILLANPSVNVCFHQVYWLDQKTGKKWFTDYGLPEIKERYNIKDLLLFSNFIPTCSAVIRKMESDNIPSWYYKCTIVDFPTNVLSLLNSKSREAINIPLPMGVYRYHDQGIYSGKSKVENAKRHYAVYEMMAEDKRLLEIPEFHVATQLRYKEYLLHKYMIYNSFNAVRRVIILVKKVVGRLKGSSFFRVIKNSNAPKNDDSLRVALLDSIKKSNYKQDKLLLDFVDIFKIKTLDYVDKLRYNKDLFFYRYKKGGWPNLYASVYSILLYGLNPERLPNQSECVRWADFVNEYQCTDGLFRDPILNNEIAETEDWWGWRHLSAHVVSALTILGEKTKYPFFF